MNVVNRDIDQLLWSLVDDGDAKASQIDLQTEAVSLFGLRFLEFLSQGYVSFAFFQLLYLFHCHFFCLSLLFIDFLALMWPNILGEIRSTTDREHFGAIGRCLERGVIFFSLTIFIFNGK